MGSAVDHGTDQLGLLNGAVHHIAQALLLFLQRLLDGGLQLLHGGDPAALQAVGIRQLHKIGAPLGGGLAEAVLIDQLLPLADHAQPVVVEDKGDDGGFVELLGGQLINTNSLVPTCTRIVPFIM